MIQLLEESQDNLIMLKVTDTLDRKDYDKALPLFEEKIKKYGKINVYLEANNLDGLTTKALWEELKFDFQHREDFSKIAVIGNDEWLEWLSRVAKYFTPAQIKHFQLEEKAAALSWLRES